MIYIRWLNSLVDILLNIKICDESVLGNYFGVLKIINQKEILEIYFSWQNCYDGL